MYEKTIGGLNLIYLGVADDATAKLVYDILAPADQQELDAILGNQQGSLKRVVDGYLYSSAPFLISHKIGGYSEIVNALERYPIPVQQWHRAVYIQGSQAAQNITVRILTS
jgi:hypothetical protein